MKKYFALRGFLTTERFGVFVDSLEVAAKSSCDELAFVFDTPGGNIMGAFASADLIRSSGKKSTAFINRGESAAVPIFLACDERVIAPDGRIFIHPIKDTVDAGAGVPIEQDPKIVSIHQQLTSRLADFIVSRTRLSADQVDKILSSKGRIFDAQEALEAGLATKIASSA